ncbi:MAG: calcium-binding protein, partial [Alphaproteobacteria bacterium]|nr:calcium-binding protein [Alphaproteobacteria bacterium]
NIENLTGSIMDDTLTGDAGANVLEGGAGADTLDGAAGTDTASYSGSGVGVTVSLATGTGSGGDAQGDTLTGIENLTGSAFDDSLTGDANANTLDGGAGLDTLIGGDGDDILLWDSADTTIDGGTGTDTLRVDSGNVDLTTFGGTISGIERIDLEADAGTNSLTLSAADVISMSDTDVLDVLGDAGDDIDAGTGWTDGGIAGGYHTYTQMVGPSLATLLVDTDMTVNADILT